MIRGFLLGLQVAVSAALLVWLDNALGSDHPAMFLLVINAVLAAGIAIYEIMGGDRYLG